MKKYSVRFGALLTLAFAVVGCVNEDPGYGEPGNPAGATGTGFLTLADVHVVADSETDQNVEESPAEAMLSRAADASNPTGVTRGEEVASLDEYKITIQGRKSAEPVFKGTYGALKTEMGDTGLEVPVDTYTITATSNASETGFPAEVQAEPSYGGEKGGVSVGKEEQTSAGTIVCKLQNIKITLSVAADLYERLDVLDSGEKIEASIYYGDNKETATVRWDVPAGWDWTLPEPPAVYFPALNADGYNTLHISFYAKLNGSEIPMNKDITDILKGQWRRIHVVQTYDTDGNLTFDAVVNSFVQDETIDIGDNGVAGTMWCELPYEDPSVAGPSIRWADGSDLPESKIMLAGAALQNVVLRAPNGIEKVALAYRTTNPDLAYYAGGLNIDDLCASKGNPTLKSFGIPYGTDLAGRQEAAFELNKLAEQIGPYDGEYAFTFTVTDRKGLSYTQTLTFVAGNVGPTVEGVGFDIDTVLEVSPEDGTVELDDGTKSPEVNVKVHSDAGIVELWVSIISAQLTPVLGEVNIPEKFNLCKLKGDMVTNMGNFGFPCNDEVEGKKDLDFRISATLMGLLKEFGGDHRFELQVVDANGEITKAILLHVDK
ncbi:MAG: DUF4493 domain-containing protein [Alistipes senegalensis]|nr:DUF4493 domain-containing protein [Bacteroides cellulosilyticus]MCM1351151.1 DUF4493 domain-containing protein [Alistipes senegalensis]